MRQHSSFLNKTMDKLLNH